MTATYFVAVDWNDDGDFTGLGEDISADVLSLRWRLGMAAPYDGVAAPSEAHITLRNTARAYSPEVNASLRPGRRVRIQSNDGVTTRTHFTGFISVVEPQPGALGERTAVIHARGPEPEVRQNRVRLPPQVDVRADQLVSAVLGQLLLRPLILKGYWLLDLDNQMELDFNTRIGRQPYPSSLETGKSTFAYAADTWRDGIPADEAIRQAVEGERGRFFVDRSGQFVFYNRHHTLLNTTSDATFADSMEGMVYTYGGALVNRAHVTYTPRSIGAPGTVLWRLERPQKLEPGEGGILRLVARFRDSNKRPIGALTVIPPVAVVDYQANTLNDGSGVDFTARVVVTLLSADTSAAELYLRNDSSRVLYLLAGMQIRGTPILIGDPLVLEAIDWGSANRYGLNTLTFDLPVVGSAEDAANTARFEIARRTTARASVHSIQVSGSNLLAQVLARTLFDRITVTESQTGHSADYFIIAESHEVDEGGARHRATWLLESAAANTFWILDRSTLASTTLVAY
jgi:hypothetical protein